MRGAIESEITDLRERISATQGEIEALREAPVPKVEYVQRVSDWIDTQAAAFAVNAEFSVSPLREPFPRADHVGFGQLRVRGSDHGDSVAEADAAGLLCWLMGDAIKAKLSEAIAAAELPEGAPAADRPRLRRDLAAQLDRMEINEERLVVEAQAAGIEVQRRSDVRPEIVLSLSLEDAA